MIGGYYQALLGKAVAYNKGWCAFMDGTNYIDLIKYASANRYQYQKSLTLTCWVNMTAINTAAHTALLGSSSWNASIFGFNLGVAQNTSNLMFYYRTGSGGNQVALTNAGTLSLNTWTFFAMELDAVNERAKLYKGTLGGSLVLLQDLPASKPTVEPSASVAGINIGTWSGRYAKDVKFFDYRQFSTRACEATELQDIFNFRHVRQGLTSHYTLGTETGITETEAYGGLAAEWVNLKAGSHYYGTDVPSYNF